MCSHRVINLDAWEASQWKTSPNICCLLVLFRYGTYCGKEEIISLPELLYFHPSFVEQCWGIFRIHSAAAVCEENVPLTLEFTCVCFVFEVNFKTRKQENKNCFITSCTARWRSAPSSHTWTECVPVVPSSPFVFLTPHLLHRLRAPSFSPGVSASAHRCCTLNPVTRAPAQSCTAPSITELYCCRLCRCALFCVPQLHQQLLYIWNDIQYLLSS